MALTKLNRRQREALVASVYEENSAEEVAEQLGLLPKVSRQMLFCVRHVFKKLLLVRQRFIDLRGSKSLEKLRLTLCPVKTYWARIGHDSLLKSQKPWIYGAQQGATN